MSLVSWGLLLLMIVGWITTLPITNEEEDLIDNTITDETEDPPEIQEYFARISAILQGVETLPSRATGDMVANYNPVVNRMNPEEMGKLYQGDIMVQRSNKRTGLLSTARRWPGGVIPYLLSTAFSQVTRAKILLMFREYQEKIPCIKFVARRREADYIYIQREQTGCWSYVGRIGRKQAVNIQDPGCTSNGTIIHELMHAAGFFHEQSREDRDNHVHINYTNIISGYESNFDKVTPGTTTVFNTPYALDSVMHYSAYAFSKNGQKTIIPKLDPNLPMGQRNGFHPNDITKLRAMYGCPA